MTEQLPDTDSPEVMEMAVSMWLTDLIWEQVARAVHADEAENSLVAIYGRVFTAVRKTRAG